QAMRNCAAEERLTQIWDLPEEEQGVPVPEGAECRAVVLEGVDFTYAGEPQPVYEDFSVRIPFGKWTCSTGVSGKGKSTLYRLILGLYKPQKGRIYLDTDRGEIPVSAATRHLFAAVPQLPTLFSGTLRENLLLVKPDASAEELTEALALAECDFADALPDGLDTRLGELGEGLSAGQRQRISIARAILMRGRMLLLDEATSALDRETEQRVLQNLATHFPSVLIATHRPDVIRREGTEHLNLERSPDGETPEKNGVAEAYEG
ncbi:MAG: ATP-binding cassette domain-containing protein, partial [Oscillibacter sp.]|nr:ATP-binding cassette domain-containing protein [Oscillibacter sp.]